MPVEPATRTPLAAAAAVWAASVGALFLSLQPLLVGALVDDVGASLQQAGNVASANMLGQFVGGVLCLILVRRVRIRKLLLAGILLLAVGDVASAALATNPQALASARVLAGCGAGMMLAGAAATVVALPSPARVFAIILFFQTLSGAAALLVAPALFASIGLQGTFIGLAAIALSSLALLPFFAQPAAAPSGAQATPGLPHLATALLLGSLFVHYVANNGVWAHFDRIGTAAAITTEDIASALSVGQLCSLVGAVAAALLATRLATGKAIAVGIIAIAVSTAMLLRVAGAGYLLASVALFIGSIGFVVPFYLAALAARDATGRLVVTGKLAIMAGLVIGPSMAAAVATRASLTAMIVFSTALFIVALLLARAGLRGEAPTLTAERAS